MNLFSRNKPQNSATAPPELSGIITPELRARVEALQSRNSTLRTAEDAVGAAQEAGALVTDLFKSVEAATKKAATPAIAATPADDYDPDADAFDPASVDNGGDDLGPEGNEPPAPAGPAPASGGKWSGKFAKSLETLAQGDEITALALQPVFHAIENSEQSGAITNDYLEQIGGLLSKALEGLQVIGENQHRLAERMDVVENAATERAAELTAQEQANYGELKKSLEPFLEFVQTVRQTPQGTPRGRVAVPDSAISAPALGDAVPQVQRVEEQFNGFSRTELKKSIEGAVRSGRYISQGLNVSHFNMLTGDTPLSELPQVVFDVASAELKRPQTPGGVAPVASPAGIAE